MGIHCRLLVPAALAAAMLCLSCGSSDLPTRPALEATRAGNGLADLSGLARLTTVGGCLRVRANGVLTRLAGLESLASVGGSVQISGNCGLTTLTGLGTPRTSWSARTPTSSRCSAKCGGSSGHVACCS